VGAKKKNFLERWLETGVKRAFVDIMDIIKISQLPDNYKAFVIEHKEGNQVKKRLFEAQSAAEAV